MKETKKDCNLATVILLINALGVYYAYIPTSKRRASIRDPAFIAVFAVLIA